MQASSNRRLKVAYVEDYKTTTPIEPEVKAAIADTAKLMERLGHTVEVIEFPFDYDRLFEAVLAFFLEKFGQLKSVVENATGTTVRESGILTPWLTSGIEYSQTFSAEQIAASKAYLDQIAGLFDKVFADYDVILAPVSPVAGVDFTEASLDDSWNNQTLQFMLSRMAFTAPVNFGGNPAMSVPLGWGGKDGLPIGSHFIADRGHDQLLYELAYELEAAQPWKSRWAPISLKYPDQFNKL